MQEVITLYCSGNKIESLHVQNRYSFLKIIIDLWLVESTDLEPMNIEGELYYKEVY